MDFEQDIKNCIAVLEKGGSILYPTDTVWGLGCDALNKQAVEKIFDIKNRPRDKSLIVLLADARDIFRYIASPPPDIIDIIEQFDRPTTVIYDQALDFPENVIHEDGTIAIRVTSDPFCKALIKRYRKPIISTSANISGAATPALFYEIDTAIRQKAGYIVSYRQDDNTRHQSSRLIKLNDEGEMEILRP